MWRASGRQDVATLLGHTGGVVGVAFAPGGRRLASLSRQSPMVSEGDGTVRVWDVDPRATLPMLRGHSRAIYPVAFSPDGRWIASGDLGGEVRLWDAATGEPWRDPASPRRRVGASVQPGRDVAVECKRPGRRGYGSGTWRRLASAAKSRFPAKTSAR